MKIPQYIFFMTLLSNIVHADAPIATDQKTYDKLLKNELDQIANMDNNTLYRKLNDSYFKLRELAKQKNDLLISLGLPSQKYDDLIIKDKDPRILLQLIVNKQLQVPNFRIKLEKAIREAMITQWRIFEPY